MISSEFHARSARGAAALLVGALCLSLGACAGTLRKPRSAPGTLDLSRALPAPTPSPFGTGSHAGIARSTLLSGEDDLDAFLLPAKVQRVAQTSRAVRVTRQPSRAVRVTREPLTRTPSKPRQPEIAQAPGAAPTRSPQVDAQVNAQTEPAAMTQPPRPVVLASVTHAPLAADAERYAAREQRSQKAERYRGGDTIVISVSTLLVVLLIVLIVMLLT